MKGLLLKDFYIIKDSLLILLLTFIAVSAGLSFLVSPWVFIIIAAVMLSMTSASTITSDKTSQWIKFAAVLPVMKKQIVSSKYIMYALLCFVGFLAGILLSSCIALLKNEFHLLDMVTYIFVGLMVCSISGSISIPLNFIFKEEKIASVGMVLSYTGTAGIFIVFILIANQFIDIKSNFITVCLVGVIVGFILFLLSWLLAKKYLPRHDI